MHFFQYSKLYIYIFICLYINIYIYTFNVNLHILLELAYSLHSSLQINIKYKIFDIHILIKINVIMFYSGVYYVYHIY